MSPVAAQYQINWGQVETLVQDYVMPTIVDQVLYENPIYYRMGRRKKNYSGGRAIVCPLQFAVEGGGGQWWSGADKIDLRIRNPITAAVYYRKNYTLAINMSRDEEDSVGGDTMLKRLVVAKMDIARPTAVDAIGQAVFNDGTDPKQIGGLVHLTRCVSGGPATSHTYGGITTSSTLNTWWQPQFIDGTSLVTGGGSTFAGTRGFGSVGRIWVKIGRASGKRPTVLISNWGLYEDYHASLAGPGGAGAGVYSGGQRYAQMNTDLVKAGFENVMYKTAPWVVDERAPHRVVSAGTNEREDLFALHEPRIYLIVHSKRDMSFDNWKEPVDQKTRHAFIDWAGELAASERRCQGSVYNVECSATS